MKQCTFVVTDQLAQKLVGYEVKNTAFGKAGIFNTHLPVDPDACKTAFGKWLAERVTTILRDDDMSRLHITIKKTEADISGYP